MQGKNNYKKCFKLRKGISAAFWGKNTYAISKDACQGKVAHNREIVAHTMDERFSNRIFVVNQKHTSFVHVLNKSNLTHEVQADAIITKVPNALIGVLSADCCPILVCDPNKYVVAAIHAGWRGAFGLAHNNNIIHNTFAELANMGCKLEELEVAIGPCIAECSYEISSEFQERFLSRSPKYQKFFHHNTENGRTHFDLPLFVIEEIKNCGIQNICLNALEDTFANHKKYYSYRRACKQQVGNKKPKYGCQISVIGILE